MRRGGRGLGVLLVATSIGCTAPATRAPADGERTVAAVELRVVDLPDLASLSDEVRAQLREQHAAMRRVVDQPSATALERAAAFGEMGKLLLAAEFLGPADAAFENAARLAPGDLRWPYYRAHVARLQGRLAEAVPHFERVLALQPDHVPSLVWAADLLLADGRHEQALALLTRAEARDPREAAVHYGLGRVALESRRTSEAIARLERALTLAPDATRVHYPLALAYRQAGDVTKAEAHMRQRGDGELPPADALLGEVGGLLRTAAAFEARAADAMAARKWADAVTLLRQAVAAAPRSAGTRLNLGTSLYMQGDAAHALDEFRAAVRLQPSLAKAHYAIAVAEEDVGRDDAALDAFTAAVTADPGFAEARLGLADALRRRGRPEEALPHYAELLRANPAASQASFGYAMALVRIGRWSEARDRLAEAARTFPDQPGFAHALARVLAAAPDDAIRNGPQALAIVQDLVRAQVTANTAETMAMAHAELGRWSDAVLWQERAIELASRGGGAAALVRLRSQLAAYRQRQPCRSPWSADDPVHRPGARS